MPKTIISQELYDYCLAKGVRESNALLNLRQESNALSNGRMLISPDQGSCLAMLAKLTCAKRYLEIGMFTGYSALWVAQALPEDGQVITLDISDTHLALAQKYWQAAGVATKITPLIAEAMASLHQLENEQQLFDLVLIDANKSQYLEYYEAALKLVRNGGLIVIDNVLMYGQVLEPTPAKSYIKVLQQLNDQLSCDPRVDICLLTIGDGMTLVRKKD